MLNVFRLVYTRIAIDNYLTTLFYRKKCQRLGMSINKVEGSGFEFNQKGGLAETELLFIMKFDMF